MMRLTPVVMGHRGGMDVLDGSAADGAGGGGALDGGALEGGALEGGAHDDRALDGNSIGGLLIDVFAAELTGASSTCAACGATRSVAELAVYRQAPGTVVRCRSCYSVLMVFVRARGRIGVDLTGLSDWPA